MVIEDSTEDTTEEEEEAAVMTEAVIMTIVEMDIRKEVEEVKIKANLIKLSQELEVEEADQKQQKHLLHTIE